MDDFSPLTTSNLNIHPLEIFTPNLVIQGNSTGPYRRSSDLVNRKDRDYILLDGARITPLGRQANMTPLDTQLMVARQHVHLVALAAQSEPEDTTGNLGQFRPSGVHKIPHPCYMLTEVYVLLGEVYMVEASTLENLLAVSELFLPMTNVTVYINSMPNNPLQRDLVLINKDQIQAMYLIPSPTATKKLEESSVATGEAPTNSTEPLKSSTPEAQPQGASTSSLLERLSGSQKDHTS
jgi:hypothetical protein